MQTMDAQHHGGRKARRLKVGTVVEPLELLGIHSEPIQIPDPDRMVHLQFRRFAGCPICKLHLRSIAVRHDELVAAGIREIAVFHSAPEALRRHDGALPFAVIGDPEKRLYMAFGIERSARSILDPRAWGAIVHGLSVFGPGPPDRGESGLGLPADFLIAPGGRVIACKYGAHADDHWSVDELLWLASSEASRSFSPS
ncbi:peroxiredoxin-like family protein [Geothrix terrae]|uniref:peroxiredoxin-like family protein n=1 Tax=Geothrix terrae TaxID=2922720 RepID=UPI001FAD9E83|nr:peroxiredoxin-like family protein [Geothrix terrae]